MGALAHAVKSGKALYVGISNYNAEQADKAITILKDLGIHCLIHQPRYNMLDRRPEQGLYDVLEKHGVGAIPYSPLAQGLLSGRYLNGIPEDSRAAGSSVFLKHDAAFDETIEKSRKLAELAEKRGQTLAQMALAWLLKSPVTASVIIGASKLGQIQDCAKAQDNLTFTESELNEIDAIAQG